MLGGGALGGGRLGRLFVGLVFAGEREGSEGGSFVGEGIGREESGTGAAEPVPRLFPEARVSSVSRIEATWGEGVRGLLFGEVLFGDVLFRDMLFGDMEPRWGTEAVLGGVVLAASAVVRTISGFRAVGIGGGAERGVARCSATFGFSVPTGLEKLLRSSDTVRAPKVAEAVGGDRTLGETGMGTMCATRGGVDGLGVVGGATVGGDTGGL